MKFKYYVGIIEGNKIKFVTKVDNSTKMCLWQAGEVAKEFKKTTADDLMFGLNCNFINAIVLKVPSYMELRNEEEV